MHLLAELLRRGIEPTTKTFTHFRHDENDPGSLSNDWVGALHEDRHGTLWVGSWGLNRYDCIHEDMIGRDPGDPILRGKKVAATVYRYFIEKADIPACELRPLAIRVSGNMAFAHYLQTTVERQPDGRFLLLESVEEASTSTQLNVVVNWFEDLKHLVPVRR